MNLLRNARSGAVIALGAAALSSSVGTGLSLTACGESASCTKLRSDTYAIKQIWDACNPDDPEPCIKVAGNGRDCTGVLSCDFAVTPRHRAEAEQTVLTIAEQSQGCYLCALPNCIVGDIAVCEPVSRRCILVTTLVDGGSASSSQPPRDAGGTVVVPPPAADTGTSDAVSAEL